MSRGETKSLAALQDERNQLVEAAAVFDLEDKARRLTSEEIQDYIEELRPIRLRIHILDQLIQAAKESEGKQKATRLLPEEENNLRN